MEHLYASHPKNRHVTTMTFETLLKPRDENAFVLPSMLNAARERMAQETSVCAAGFKNSFQVTLHVKSTRDGAPLRKVSIKVFKNVRLHITGTHSIEMLDQVIAHITAWLERELPPLEEDKTARRVDVVLYKYQLPGPINMLAAQELLCANNVLTIYDPSTYAGLRAKFPITDRKQASVMIFRLGKVIIIIPKQESFDVALKEVCDSIERLLVGNWDIVGSRVEGHTAGATAGRPPAKKKRAAPAGARD